MQTHTLTTAHNGLFDITEQVVQSLHAAQIVQGILVVAVPHSTAAVTVASHWDPLSLEDINDELGRLVPTRVDFKHQVDTPSDAAGHVKAALIGHSRTFLVDQGKVVLGASQRIFLWEFDAPRQRNFQIQVLSL